MFAFSVGLKWQEGGGGGYLMLLGRVVVLLVLRVREVVRRRGDVHVAGSAERGRGAAVERRLLVALRKRNMTQ